MTLTTQLYLVGSGAIALWLFGFGLSLLATRNGTVEPGPATQELGPDPESPAVVSLLGNHWRSVKHAAGATLLDLASRGLIELRQPGDDPAHTTVHLIPDTPATLTPYERRVLDRVATHAGSGGAPIGAIAFRAEKHAAAWNRELRQEIIAEARLRGLSRPRFGRLLGSALTTTTFVPGVLFGLAVVIGGHPVRAAFFVGAAPAVVLMALLAITMGERATPAGLARAGHWTGVRAWLGAHDEFAQLPPAAVAVWDRYMAYGTALGVTSRTSRLLGFDAGDRRRVWSSYGGTWREVRIRYPRLRPGFGGSTGRLLQLAAAAAVVAVGLYVFAVLRQPGWAVTSGPDASNSLRRPGLLLSAGWVGIGLLGVTVAGRFSRWMPLLGFLALMPGNFASAHGWLGHAMDRSGPLPGETAAIVFFSALTACYLVLAGLERRTPDTLTGEVLRVEARGKKAARFLALDEGGTDRTIAWALPAAAPDFVPGSTVRMTVSRATRTIRHVEVLTMDLASV